LTADTPMGIARTIRSESDIAMTDLIIFLIVVNIPLRPIRKYEPILSSKSCFSSEILRSSLIWREASFFMCSKFLTYRKLLKIGFAVLLFSLFPYYKEIFIIIY
jgi:hypothetical protein